MVPLVGVDLLPDDFLLLAELVLGRLTGVPRRDDGLLLDAADFLVVAENHTTL